MERTLFLAQTLLLLALIYSSSLGHSSSCSDLGKFVSLTRNFQGSHCLLHLMTFPGAEEGYLCTSGNQPRVQVHTSCSSCLLSWFRNKNPRTTLPLSQTCILSLFRVSSQRPGPGNHASSTTHSVLTWNVPPFPPSTCIPLHCFLTRDTLFSSELESCWTTAKCPLIIV